MIDYGCASKASAGGAAVLPANDTAGCRERSGRFQFVDRSEIWRPLEEPDFLVEAIIRRGSVTEVVAYGSSGKSWLACDMVLSVAHGVPWLEHFTTKRGRVAYLDYENGAYEMRRRLQGIARARDVYGSECDLDICCMP